MADLGGKISSSAIENSARIPTGGLLEGGSSPSAIRGEQQLVAPGEPDVTMATRIATAINKEMGDGTASVDDPGSISLKFKDSKEDHAALLARGAGYARAAAAHRTPDHRRARRNDHRRRRAHRRRGVGEPRRDHHHRGCKRYDGCSARQSSHGGGHTCDARRSLAIFTPCRLRPWRSRRFSNHYAPSVPLRQTWLQMR